jgi:hypothetical protein
VSRLAPAGEARLPLPSELSTQLVRLGLDPAAMQRSVTVRAAKTVRLDTLVRPRSIETRDLGEYKSWVGVEDHEIDPDQFPLRESQIPSQAWSGRPVTSLADLTDEERIDVERARDLYLFGYSPWTESYRQVIETCFAPFTAKVYCAESVRIAPEGRLVIDGVPAILLVNRLTIDDGGQLAITAVCRAWIGHLVKNVPVAH